jgi:mannitol-1-phosphate/altronate dehydrogenase
VLQREDWWGKDLRQVPGTVQAVSGFVESILNRGIRATMQQVG